MRCHLTVFAKLFWLHQLLRHCLPSLRKGKSPPRKATVNVGVSLPPSSSGLNGLTRPAVSLALGEDSPSYALWSAQWPYLGAGEERGEQTQCETNYLAKTTVRWMPVTSLSQVSPKICHLLNSVLKTYEHYLFTSLQPYEVGADDLVSQRRKLSLKEVKSQAQDHRNDQWQSQQNQVCRALGPGLCH